MECLYKCFQNILLLLKIKNVEKNYEIIEDKDVIKDEKYWVCFIGNKHPKSQKICKCYWDSI